MTTQPTPAPVTHSFSGLGISPELLDVLGRLKFTVPTPIQLQSIPAAVEGKDVIGIAQTGTGKTLAFGVPLMQRLRAHGGNGLVILPTRELALQVDETFRKLGHGLGFRTAVLIGGMSMSNQIRAIREKPHIVIATPGRLIDHLEQNLITLKSVKVLVLDEADRMLDMGFAPQINKILALVPKERQTLLFSATMPQQIVKIATSHMKLPVRVEIAPQGTASANVIQEVFVVEKANKIQLLEKLLTQYHGTVLVFSRTKHGAKKITSSLRAIGQSAAEIHANRSQAQRRDALEGFKTGRYRVLVATDIASRGIDVKGIELVVNFDLPENPEDYVHRIGRTGRAGQEGRAISFSTPDQRSDLMSIERLIRNTLPRKQLPADLPPPRPSAIADRPDRPSFGGRRSGGYRGGGGGGGRGGRGGYRR